MTEQISTGIEQGPTLADGTTLSGVRLRVVFNLVKPVGNWKLPINATVPKALASAEEIRGAVAWFAGGFPTVEPASETEWRVTGAGYYAWIGA